MRQAFLHSAAPSHPAPPSNVFLWPGLFRLQKRYNSIELGSETNFYYAMPTTSRLICHITHINNLPSIMAEGGIHACSTMQQQSIAYENIAQQTVQDRRATIRMKLSPGGMLHDYVPFYFAPRSPMLYCIYKKIVEGYEEGQSPVIYLVTNCQAIEKNGLSYVFTDGHAVKPRTQFYDRLSNLDKVDWLLMKAKIWKATADDPDRTRRRQAEFLVHRFLPWTLITEVGVIDNQTQQTVREHLAETSRQPAVNVHRGWYY